MLILMRKDLDFTEYIPKADRYWVIDNKDSISEILKEENNSIKEN